MQIIPRRLQQFSLRGLFVVMALVSLLFGMQIRRVLEYKSAVRQLRARGISLGCTHPDGLGPDFLYSWELFRFPLSYMNEWYDKSLRIEVHDMALVRNTTLTKSDIEHLAKIPFSHGISIHDSRFEPSVIETMANSCRFDQIAFVDTPLTVDEYSQIASMTCLTKIWLLGISRSEEGIAILSKALPDCEIALE